MDSDREWLEWAAKAAGLTIARWVDGVPQLASDTHQLGVMWNPRKNGEQALQLAVKLDLIIRQPGYVMWTEYGPGFGEDTYPDPYDATLKAIVRAAAEIGKTMHEPKPD